MPSINLGDRVRIKIPKKFRLADPFNRLILPNQGWVMALNYQTINRDMVHGGVPQYAILADDGRQFRIPKDWCRRIKDGE